MQSSLVEMTVDVNLAGMESLIGKTIEDAVAASQVSSAASPAGPLPSPVSAVDADPLAAEALAERVAARVSEQVVRMVAAAREADVRTPEPVEPVQPAVRDQSEPVIETTALTRLLGAVEALEVQMTALRDQGRMSSAAVQALTDQMARDARRSDVTAQHLVDVITEELDRLGRRLGDHQTTLAAPPDI